jgi:galactokinase
VIRDRTHRLSSALKRFLALYGDGRIEALRAPAPHWSNYVKGAVSFARWKYGARVERGFDFLIESSIPPQSGASSSSALVTLAGAAIRRVNRIDFELNELARDSSQAEWFVGTRGGALDIQRSAWPGAATPFTSRTGINPPN